MNRRAFLGSAGALLSVGTAHRLLGPADEHLDVRVWFSEAAAEREGLEARIEEYLVGPLQDAYGPVELTFASARVSLPAEDGRRVLARTWPRRVLQGAVGLGDVDPTGDVNLLVTDGDPRGHPAGFARARIAAVVGAGAIASMPPADETPAEVPYSIPAHATQLLLHECGHALGLDHDDGTATVRDGAVVASPMISAYAWAAPDRRREHLGTDESACGSSYPTDVPVERRRLSLRYADCAARALRGRAGRPL